MEDDSVVQKQKIWEKFSKSSESVKDPRIECISQVILQNVCSYYFVNSSLSKCVYTILSSLLK